MTVDAPRWVLSEYCPACKFRVITEGHRPGCPAVTNALIEGPTIMTTAPDPDEPIDIVAAIRDHADTGPRIISEPTRPTPEQMARTEWERIDGRIRNLVDQRATINVEIKGLRERQEILNRMIAAAEKASAAIAKRAAPDDTPDA